MNHNLPITLSGKVVAGEQVGRTIGFPTANLDIHPDEKELPLGVYVGTCQVEGDDTSYNCLAYFGPRHIFGETINNFEVYIYDFDQQIYNQSLTVTLTAFVRAPIKINSLAKLGQQLTQDKKQGLIALKKIS